MKRFGLATVLGLLIVGFSQAHFVYIVPDGTTSSKGKVIFSDSLKPDEKVNIEKISNSKLFVVADGKQTDLKWELGKACYTIDVPGSGNRVVAGTTDYGVLQKGDDKPFLLQYHPKAIFGEVTATSESLGNKVPLEIVPVVNAGTIKFQAVSGGKPVEKAEISVMVPGEESAKAGTTDEKGFTQSFDKTGTYAVRVKLVDNKPGEKDGKKYEETRHYATLVLNFATQK